MLVKVGVKGKIGYINIESEETLQKFIDLGVKIRLRLIDLQGKNLGDYSPKDMTIIKQKLC